MAHVLKRKRGEADTKLSVKRTKSIQKQQNITSERLHERQPSINQTKELAQPNNLNDQKNDVSGSPIASLAHEKLLVGSISAEERITCPWKLSSSTGGRIIKCDPVFTADEKYLIVANLTTIQVYATSDSLLYCSIPLKLDPAIAASTRIVSTCLSSTNTNTLWVACSDGSIFNVDWTTGAGAGCFWTVSSTGCKHMTVSSMLSNGRRRDVIFTTEARKNGGFRTTAFELADPNGPIAIAARTIYTSPEPIQSLKAATDGSVIVGVSGKKVLVGRLRSTAFDTVDKIKFEFRTFESKDPITSLDIRFSKTMNTEATKKENIPKIPVVDLVLGNMRGAIFVHTDLVGKLFGRAPKGTAPSTTSLVPSKHHWHRQAVNSVKWSLDGNYMISGGAESTLVLWQMETGKRDFLPHMSAVIKNIVVSPTGSAYAILLSDNSAMIISTTNLLPKFNIAGIQAPVIQTKDSVVSESLEALRAEGKLWSEPLLQRVPAVINPVIPSSLLLAVGPVQEVRASKPFILSNPFLQEFDLGTSRSLLTQALARTNITNVNAAPNAHCMIEPRVIHMKISSDGLWLATVDEWIPPNDDFEFLEHKGNENMRELSQRREIHLKFWERNKTQSNWELVSRIDRPHDMSDGYSESGIVLDLASHPSRSQFATLGNNGSVKVWLPKSRKRDGILVRGQNNEVLKNWCCSHTTKLGKLECLDKTGDNLSLPLTGCLSFSEDGSVLAAALGCRTGLIYLIDSNSGKIQISIDGIIENDVFGMKFLGQDLIILSQRLLSFDVVSQKIRHSLQIRSSVDGLSVHQKKEMMHLAVDHKSKTFAVALPKPTTSTEEPLAGFRSELIVFHPEYLEPQLKDFHDCLITALLPVISSEGYIILDSNADIRTVLPKGAHPVTSMAQSTSALKLDIFIKEATDSKPEIMDVDEEEDNDMEDLQNDNLRAALQNDQNDEDDYDFPVVNQNQIDEIFDAGPAFALPPIQDLFYQVTGILTNKLAT